MYFQLPWQSAIVLTVCNCLDSRQLSRQSANVYTVCTCLLLSWQPAIVMTVFNCLVWNRLSLYLWRSTTFGSVFKPWRWSLSLTLWALRKINSFLRHNCRRSRFSWEPLFAEGGRNTSKICHLFQFFSAIFCNYSFLSCLLGVGGDSAYLFQGRYCLM